MPATTKYSVRLLAKEQSEIIISALTATKLALERLYKSDEGQLLKEEIWKDVVKVLESSERIKTTNSPEDKLQQDLSNFKTLFKQLKTKYGDFIPDKIINFFEAGEISFEGFKYIVQAVESGELINHVGQLYTGMVLLSEGLEQIINYLPNDSLVRCTENLAWSILRERTLQPKQPGISETTASSLFALKNTSRAILWQIENYRKLKKSKQKRKHTVGKLLSWIENSPGWAGDGL